MKVRRRNFQIHLQRHKILGHQNNPKKAMIIQSRQSGQAAKLLDLGSTTRDSTIHQMDSATKKTITNIRTATLSKTTKKLSEETNIRKTNRPGKSDKKLNHIIKKAGRNMPGGTWILTNMTQMTPGVMLRRLSKIYRNMMLDRKKLKSQVQTIFNKPILI